MHIPPDAIPPVPTSAPAPTVPPREEEEGPQFPVELPGQPHEPARVGTVPAGGIGD